MRIFVGFGDYPHTIGALRGAGATVVPALREAKGFVFTQTPGTESPELPPQVTLVQLPNAGINEDASHPIVAGRMTLVSMERKSPKPPWPCYPDSSISTPR